MDNEKTIDVLNSLVRINNDRLEGYETASKETEEHDLVTLFEDLSRTSIECRQELIAEIHKLGGEHTEGTKITGKFFRAWMDVKVALSNKDRQAILTSCEFGEDNALATYENVIDDEFVHLDEEQQAMVNRQYELLQKDHDRVKAMRDEAKRGAA